MSSSPRFEDTLFWPPGQKPYAKQSEAFDRSFDKTVYALFLEQRTGKTLVALGTASHNYDLFLAAGGFGPLPRTPASSEGDAPARERVNAPQPRPYRAGGGPPFLNRIRDLPKKPSKPGMIYRPGAWANEGIDGIVVIAMPGGVPRNWEIEARARLPERANAKTLVWRSDKADAVWWSNEFFSLLAHEGLACLFINGEAISTATCKKAIGTFLRTRRALVINDESSLVASRPGNARAKVMTAIRKLPGSVMRRILDGTPADESPLDMYSQVGFLDPAILAIGDGTFDSFKNFYGVWEENPVWVAGKLEKFPKLVGYANLDFMRQKLGPVSFRVKRTDCFDVPEKVFAPYHFELSPAQRKVYDPLREEFRAFLSDGTKVSAPAVLGRLVRLDQVRANYWPSIKVPTMCGACGGDGCEACGDVGAIMSLTEKKIIDPDRNPLLEAVAAVLSVNRDPGIIWAAFDETIDAILALATTLGRTPVRYDGKVSVDQKAINFAAFQGGRADLLIAKEGSAGRGLDGRAAKWLVYAENGYSNRKRSQSEDRAEVAGRIGGTGIIDLMAEDTYDEAKREAHRTKRTIKEVVMGERSKAAEVLS